MELFDNLAAIGLTRQVLSMLIVGGFAVIAVGMFWQQIVLGAGIFFAVFCLVGPINATTDNSKAWSERKIEEMDAANKKEFLKDCTHYGDSLVKCEEIWNERDR
jgi:hypothetical protein